MQHVRVEQGVHLIPKWFRQAIKTLSAAMPGGGECTRCIPSVGRVNPCFEIAQEARFPMLDRYMLLVCLFKCLPGKSSSHHVEHLCPYGLSCEQLYSQKSGPLQWKARHSPYLDPILPLAIPIMSHQHKRAYFVRYARVTPQASVDRTSLKRALEYIPILLLERRSCTPRNLPAQVDRIARFRVAKIRARVPTFEEWRIENMRIRVL